MVRLGRPAFDKLIPHAERKWNIDQTVAVHMTDFAAAHTEFAAPFTALATLSGADLRAGSTAISTATAFGAEGLPAAEGFTAAVTAGTVKCR